MSGCKRDIFLIFGYLLIAALLFVPTSKGPEEPIGHGIYKGKLRFMFTPIFVAERISGKKRFNEFRKEDLDSWLEKDIRKTSLLPDINQNLLTNFTPLVIDKVKGGQKVARASKSRHNYGYGSVYIWKTKKGTPRFYIDYYDYEGRRKQKLEKNATSWQEAHEALRSAVLDEHYKRCGINHREKKIGFRAFSKVYLHNYAKIAKKSWETDKYRLNILSEFFKDTELREITPLMIEKFRAWRFKKRSSQQNFQSLCFL